MGCKAVLNFARAEQAQHISLLGMYTALVCVAYGLHVKWADITTSCLLPAIWSSYVIRKGLGQEIPGEKLTLCAGRCFPKCASAYILQATLLLNLAYGKRISIHAALSFAQQPAIDCRQKAPVQLCKIHNAVYQVQGLALLAFFDLNSWLWFWLKGCCRPSCMGLTFDVLLSSGRLPTRQQMGGWCGAALQL